MPQVWRVKIFGSVYGMDDQGRSIPLRFGVYEMREVAPQLYQLTGTAFPAVRLTAAALRDYIGMRMKFIEGGSPEVSTAGSNARR